MSYTFTQTGPEIQDILDRAEAGGQLDNDIAAKAPLASPALTGNPTAPTQSEGDNSAKLATTAYADRAARDAASAVYPTDSVSGDVVSFPDGADNIPVKSFVGSIVPIQDLHGYYNPWPAGGGKNKLNATGTHANVTLANGVYTLNTVPSSGVQFTIGTIDLSAGNYLLNGGLSNNFRCYISVDGTNYVSNSATDTPFTVATAGIYTVYGVITTSATANAKLSPMIRLASFSDPTFAPYSNICPISGWAGAEIYRTGINVWDEQWEVGSINQETGANSTASNVIRAKNICACQPGMALYLGTNVSAIYWYGANDAYIGFEYNNATGNIRTAPANAKGFRFLVKSSYGTTYNNDISINYPATDTAYHAYDGQTILLTFGSTVYAGTITALGGGKYAIQPTYGIVTYDGSADEGWTLEASGRYYIELDGLIKSLDYAAYGYVMCDRLKTVAHNSSAMEDLSITGYADTNNTYPTKNWLYVRQSAAADLASYKTWLGSNNLEVVYRLATLPDPIIVSASDLATLLGSNTVWQSCGSVTELTYRADTSLYVQKLIGGGSLGLSMTPQPLSLGRVGVLAEPEVAEPEQTDEEAEQLEQTEESEQAEEE